MSLLGFIFVTDITVFQATVKRMEQSGEMEENNKCTKEDTRGKKVEYENLFNQFTEDCSQTTELLVGWGDRWLYRVLMP